MTNYSKLCWLTFCSYIVILCNCTVLGYDLLLDSAHLLYDYCTFVCLYKSKNPPLRSSIFQQFTTTGIAFSPGFLFFLPHSENFNNCCSGIIHKCCSFAYARASTTISSRSKFVRSHYLSIMSCTKHLWQSLNKFTFSYLLWIQHRQYLHNNPLHKMSHWSL